MAIALEDIIEELKVLPPDKLAAAASFIEDLKESEEELSVEWKQEIDKRLEDIRLGRVETIPAEKVHREIYDKLAKNAH